MHARDSILRSDVSIARKWFKDDLLGQYEKIFSGYRKISLSPGEPERLRQSDEKIADVRLALEPFGYSHLAAVNPFGLNDFVVGVPSNIAFDMPAAFLYARPEIFSGLNYRVVDDPFAKIARVEADCAELASRSKEALEGVDPAQLFPSFTAGQFKPLPHKGALNNCINCHVRNRFASDPVWGKPPMIPFDQPGLLARWLREKPGFMQKMRDRILTPGSGQMPPNGELSQEEREALIATMETLANFHFGD
jgi:hypothetical protein